MSSKPLLLTTLIIIAAFAGCTGSSGPSDSDGDGVPDGLDLCPNTPPGAIVDANGCEIGCSSNPKLTAFDETMHDKFGVSVAIHGNTAVVGAFHDEDTGSLQDNNGSAYVYSCTGSTWILEEKLVASDGEAIDRFGFSVDIFGDTIVIGSPYSEGSDRESGSAYVYTRTILSTGPDWSFQQKLKSSDGLDGDRFGTSVSIYGDMIVVGADGVDGFINYASTEYNNFGYGGGCHGMTSQPGGIQNLPCSVGAAYVFTRSGTIWTEEARLNASDSDAHQFGDDAFGYDVAIFRNTIVVGSKWDAEWNQSTNCAWPNVCQWKAGSAYVFRQGSTIDPNTGFLIWNEEAKLTASDQGQMLGIEPQSSGGGRDWFGYSVDIYEDTIVVGSPKCGGKDDRSGSNSMHWCGYSPCPYRPGKVYIYTRSGTTWTEQAILNASDADQQNLNSYTSPYVPGHDLWAGDTWNKKNNKFGADVAIYKNTVIVGAPEDTSIWPQYQRGSAYVFTRSGTTWTEDAKLLPADGFGPQTFGNAVALDGYHAIIGSYGDEIRPYSSGTGTDAGSAYVCILEQDGLICQWTPTPPPNQDDGKPNNDLKIENTLDTVTYECPYDAETCAEIGFEEQVFTCENFDPDPIFNSTNSTDNPPQCGDGVVDEDEACDDGNTEDGDGCSANCTTEQNPTEHFIDITDMSFNPPTLNISIGDTVTWRNQDNSRHTVTEENDTFGSESLDNGDTFSFTFSEAGTFRYQCDIHPSMSAEINVE